VITPEKDTSVFGQIAVGGTSSSAAAVRAGRKQPAAARRARRATNGALDACSRAGCNATIP
jgi:hypothetical protein